MAVTDHDTMASVPRASELCAQAGMTLVPGIEITAMEAGREIHVLGYFLDAAHDGLQEFLARQQRNRLDRVHAIADRLAAAGAPIDIQPLVSDADRHDGRSIGRPQVARAMIARGEATSIDDAFERWLSPGRPAYVPRGGLGPLEAITAIRAAGGLPALAHYWGAPNNIGPLRELRDAGLGGLEVHHRSFDLRTVEVMTHIARALRLVATGGSDYHGDLGPYAEAHAGLWVPDEIEAPLRAALAR